MSNALELFLRRRKNWSPNPKSLTQKKVKNSESDQFVKKLIKIDTSIDTILTLSWWNSDSATNARELSDGRTLNYA